MLISFTVENWMSFREPATLSMVAGREKQHGNHKTKLGKHGLSLLPVAAIYGGNASGKSNLCKAMGFARDFVIAGTSGPMSKIAAQPFKLNPDTFRKPSIFTFAFAVQSIIYEYSFAVTSQAVIEEKLLETKPSGKEVELFKRSGESIEIHESLLSAERKGHLDSIRQSTRPNQLFLTQAVNMNALEFKSVYEWFAGLILVDTRSHFAQIHDFVIDENLSAETQKVLYELDTGISRISSEEVKIEALGLPEALMDRMRDELDREMSETGISFGSYRFHLKNGAIVASKLVFYHLGKDGYEGQLEYSEESEGTQRLLDVVPIFIKPANRIYIIDELDCSLHTLLVRKLLEIFLNGRSAENRSQLIFTTHDVMLMDQDMFRRDELWLTERDSGGNSTLMSISDYKDMQKGKRVRKDKDIRKSYLFGRFGGIPRIFLSSVFDDKGDTK